VSACIRNGHDHRANSWRSIRAFRAKRQAAPAGGIRPITAYAAFVGSRPHLAAPPACLLLRLRDIIWPTSRGSAIVGTLRFLLALTVALGHGHMPFGYYGTNGVFSVQAFYMVSGFLISLILCTKYDARTPEGLRLFYSNRAIRIYMTYWIIFFGTLLVPVIFWWWDWQGNINSVPYYLHEIKPATLLYIIFTNLFIIGQEIEMWLWYDHGSISLVFNADQSTPHMSAFQILPQAWTLSLELCFYALAPFLIRRHWISVVAAAALVCGCYLLRRYGFEHGASTSGWYYRFFPFELGLFMAGSLAYRLYAFLEQRNVLNVAVSIGATAAITLAVLTSQYFDYVAAHRFRFLSMICVALPVLFDFSRRFKLDRWIGELSFPLYLIHLSVYTFAGTIFFHLFGAPRNADIYNAALVMIAVIMAALYTFYIDAPIERWRAQRSRSAPKPIVFATGSLNGEAAS
jgi:peptidoglycan/LPS O-acetylase OafA/YrhL